MEFTSSSSTVIWIGIILCLAHSAMFSGLNLGVFGISRLRLEIEAASGNEDAKRLLALRQDSHFLLTTVLWGNVAVNCLLTLLMDSVFAGVAAFLLSTVGITLFGEIFPQAFFSRYSLAISAFLSPYLKLWQKVLYPAAKPTAALLDFMLGKEGIQYYRERDFREMIKKHMRSDNVDIDHIEGLGALNFLALDDIHVSEEGEPLDELSVVALPTKVDLPLIPDFTPNAEDSFVQKIRASGRRWIVLTDLNDEPKLVMDSDSFFRDVFGRKKDPVDAYDHCHRPIVITDPALPLGDAITQFTVEAEHDADDVIDHDIILVWAEERRVITGADLLGRLFRGIAKQVVRKPAQSQSEGESP